jgi:hypothetical protein
MRDIVALPAACGFALGVPAEREAASGNGIMVIVLQIQRIGLPISDASDIRRQLQKRPVDAVK